MHQLNEIQRVIQELGLPDEFFIRRRVARALSIPESDVDVEQSIVHSQVEDPVLFGVSPVWYNVSLNGGSPSCTCPDGDRTIYCKHRIALMFRGAESRKAGLAVREGV